MIIEQDGKSYIEISALFNAAQKPVIMAPFFGVFLPVVVRRLTHTQIRSCGDFSLIETVTDMLSNKNKKIEVSQMVDYAELQYQLIKKSLVSPTYDEIMSLNEYDVLRLEVEKELKELEVILNDMPSGLEKNKLMKDYYTAKMNSEFFLPADFVAYIVSFALRIDDSDIKDVSEDMLYEAAIKAKNGHDNPADHLHGNFSDFNREDINNRSWIVYNHRNKK